MSFFRSLIGSNTPADNLRIIITRHGERTDLALGPGWARRIQGGRSDPRVSYLARRADFREWDNDPPLTVNGERQGRSTGRKLLQLGYPIDYCYSSSAYRSIQTATQILQSQDRKAVPINVEPGRKSHDSSNHRLSIQLSSWNRSIWMSFLVCWCTTFLHTSGIVGYGSTLQYQHELFSRLRRRQSSRRREGLLQTITSSNRYDYENSQGSRWHGSLVGTRWFYRSDHSWSTGSKRSTAKSADCSWQGRLL